MKKPIIVGFDPGTTAGIAIINTSGDILFLTSKNNLKKGEIINYITMYGKPIIIASDKKPLPRNVSKLAKSLSARTFYPFESLSTSEKLNLVKEYDIKVKNDHERDALAAALKAYRYYLNIFRKTKNTLSSLGLSEIYPDVINRVIIDEAENINEAIEKVLNEKREETREEIIIKNVNSKDTEIVKLVEKLREELRRREKDILILKNFNEKLENENKLLKEKIDKSQKKKYEKSDILKKEVFDKDEIIKKLKDFRLLEIKGLLPLIELEYVKLSIVEFLEKYFGLEERIIFLKNKDDIHLLNDYKIKAVILKEDIDKEILKMINFPVINEKDIPIKKIDQYNVIDEKIFNEKIMQAKKRGLIQWIQNYKKRKY